MFEIQAHRANDLQTLRRLTAASPSSLEVDVGVTADLAVIASHELCVTIAECGKSPLVGQPWRVLESGQAEQLGRLTLEQVLCAAGATRVVVEAKSAPPETLDAATFVGALAPWLHRIELASFDERVLAAARALRPELRTTFLFEQPPWVETAAATIGPRHDLVDAELVRAAHAFDVRVVPWTVNDAPTMRALASFDVDGLVTDDPALAREAVGGLVDVEP